MPFNNILRLKYLILMKYLTAFLFQMSFLTSFSQQKSKSIYTLKKHFAPTEEQENESDSIFFYASNTKTKVLSFCNKLSWGDCNSMAYEWGKFEIKKNTIILYSLYAYQGGTNGQPFGVRKQKYIYKKGKVEL